MFVIILIGLAKPYTVFVHDECFTYDAKYDGDNINFNGNGCQKTNTAKECHDLCSNTQTCAQFTWMSSTVSGREKECCLKSTTSSSSTPHSGAVSGPKLCGKFCYAIQGYLFVSIISSSVKLKIDQTQYIPYRHIKRIL